MRLVSYDREGVRRLGGMIGAVVVDLPTAVGHPVFPSTMEGLVCRNGGTTLDGARHALGLAETTRQCGVAGAILLAPVIPSSLREFLPDAQDESDAAGAESRAPDPVSGVGAAPSPRRAVLGPDDEIPGPPPGSELRCELQIACVAGRGGRKLSPRQAAAIIFGYTLMAEWSVAPRSRRGRRAGAPEEPSTGVAVSLGPCIATPDEFQPEGVAVQARVDGEIWAQGSLDGVTPGFPRLVSEVSRVQDISGGDVFGSSPLGFGYRLTFADRRKSRIEVRFEAEGLGMLRTFIARAR